MRWVKETFPPRERARWLLTTIRLSASSLAGTARTLVAVGTVSEAFMFLTTLAAAPRSGVCFGPWPDGAEAAGRGLAARGRRGEPGPRGPRAAPSPPVAPAPGRRPRRHGRRPPRARARGRRSRR